MSLQIIQQPDGLFAIFSSISNTFTTVDATADEVVACFIEHASRIAEDAARRELTRLQAGIRTQLALTWQQALSRHRLHQGNGSDEFNMAVEETAGRCAK